MTTEQITWTEFKNVGRVDTIRYRTNANATHVEFWSDHNVSGLARKGWNRTRSATVQVMARKALRAAGVAPRGYAWAGDRLVCNHE